MNRIFLITILVASMLCSCSDVLDVTPENSVTFKSFYKTEDDMETAINSLKYSFKSNHCMDAATDDRTMRALSYAEITGWVEAYTNINSWAYGPTASTVDWSGYYNIINNANIVLRYIDKPAIAEDRRDFYKGQALFFRAFSYLEIARYWGDAPLVKFDGDGGLKAKSKWNEVVEFAIKDAEEAIDLLPVMTELKDSKGNTLTFKDTPCKETCYALLAHAYAWYGALADNNEYLQKSVDMATKVIDSPNFSFASDIEEVCTSVLVGESASGIFEIHNDVSEQRWANPWNVFESFVAYPVRPEHGKGDIKYNNFKIKNTTVEEMFASNDLRRDSYFYNFEEMKAEDPDITGGFAYPYKYRKIKTGTESWNTGKFDRFDQHIVIYRLTDFILLRAECNARMGKEGLAIPDLNRIRNRAGVAAYPAAGETDLKYAIFKEREKEMLWEGVKFFDVVRNGYWKTELAGDFANLTEQDVIDGALYLPVNQYAFTNNPLMTQNKFWLRRY